MRLPVRSWLPLLFVFVSAACVTEGDDVADDTQALTATAAPVHFAVRNDLPQLVSYGDLTSGERNAFDGAFKVAARNTSADEIRCISGGSCDGSGCTSWAICAGGGKVARTVCNSSGCTTTVHD